MNKKKIFFIAFLAIILAVGVVIGYTSAYFTAEMINSSESTNTVVTTARMEIEFTDGPEVKLENSMPGTSVEKTFKVKNTGEADTVYDVYMSEVANDFVDKSDLVYTLTSTDGGKNITETQVPGENTKIVSEQALGVGDEHNYKLKIDFKETNDNQDDNKDKIFTVTVRVNEVKELSNIAVDVIKRITDGSIADDETADHNIRYIGTNPNNYVWFNDELWRIIGIMNNIETESGQTESLLKIRRNDSLGTYAWDTSVSSVNYGGGINQWGQSGTYEGADLMRELNYDYLGDTQVGTDGYWYDSSENSKSAAMPSTAINDTSKSMIESVKWYLGTPNNDNGTAQSYDTEFSNVVTASYMYAAERTDTNGKTCPRATLCNDSVERVNTWFGKIGLIYPSDYGYATAGDEVKSREDCLNTSLRNYASYGSGNCTNWLRTSDNQYLISPVADSVNARVVHIIYSTGNLNHTSAAFSKAVYPTLHLKSTVKIVSGTGTQADPYTLG